MHAAIFQSVAVSDLEPGWVGSEVILRQFVEIARSSALSEMASAIAHEINQPLGAIATFSQAGDRLLNRADPMGGRALEVFREINSEALAAGDGIRRIRKLLESATPDRSLGRIQPVIEELRPVLEMMANSANIPFSVMVETPSPTCCSTSGGFSTSSLRWCKMRWMPAPSSSPSSAPSLRESNCPRAPTGTPSRSA